MTGSSPRYRLASLDEVAADVRPTMALVPAGGEVWEDFLDTIGLDLDRFCTEGPGGWILGHVRALSSEGWRTAMILFSGRIKAARYYLQPESGAVIAVLPAPRWYLALRGPFATYHQVNFGPRRQGAVAVLRQVIGAGLSLCSTPRQRFDATLSRLGCRAIIAQEYEYFRLDACLAAGRRSGLPVFASFQGGTQDSNVLSRRWKRRSLERCAALLIAASDEVARVRRAYGSSVRIRQIFNPVDLADWPGPEGRDGERRRLGLADDEIAVMWHGRIAIHSKGLDVMVAAWRRMRASHPHLKARLFLKGTGEDAGAFAALLTEANCPSIDWDDRFDTDLSSIRRFLSAGDIYAFPSRLEGFPVAPIEAMSCHLPVVGADASGVADIVGPDAPACVPCGDVEAFATALAALISEPETARARGLAARRRVETALSAAAAGKDLMALLREHDATGGGTAHARP
ncbi:glycosyltransferase family 4 protein [Frigidibacter sp. MR17.24]|uniref:glycosyltransferase family 4 protein n=1 Tax=Frigidibacter sp. MR17.24 TaxID=3127345 RepID=UPI003012C89E